LQRLVSSIGEELAKQCVFIGVSNDGVEVKKNVAYTPITGRIYNAPPEVRGLLRMILLLGYCPPKVKSYKNMFQPLCDQFERHCPRGENAVPFKVYNAYTKCEQDKWLVLASFTNDIRGLPTCTSGSQPPCYVGSCNWCEVMGQYHGETTLIPGQVRLLP